MLAQSQIAAGKLCICVVNAHSNSAVVANAQLAAHQLCSAAGLMAQHINSIWQPVF